MTWKELDTRHDLWHHRQKTFVAGRQEAEAFRRELLAVRRYTDDYGNEMLRDAGTIRMRTRRGTRGLWFDCR